MDDNHIEMEVWGDNVAPHYMLNGERFKHDTELLKLIAKYDGTCTEDPSAYALSTNCNFDCLNCKNSIYYILKNKERFFYSKCLDLCKRIPRRDDEWEISLVYQGSTHMREHFQSYYFKCLDAVSDVSIIERAFQGVATIYPQFYTESRYCYVKIRRFDMSRPMDVSPIANQYIRAFLRGESIEDVSIQVDQ